MEKLEIFQGVGVGMKTDTEGNVQKNLTFSSVVSWQDLESCRRWASEFVCGGSF